MVIAKLIKEAAEKYPERTAVIYEDQYLTFKETYKNSKKLANALLDLGLKKGDKIAFLLSNSLQSVEIDFALLMTGLVRVPLNTRLSEEEHLHMMNETEARALLFTEEFKERVIVLKENVQNTEFFCQMNGENNATDLIHIPDRLINASSQEPAVVLEASDLATIQYTSGTTGVMKAAMHTQGVWKSICMNIKGAIDISEEDVMLHAAPLTHASGTLVLPHWISGAANAVVSSFEPESFLQAIEKYKVTTLNLVPTMITMLVLHPNVEMYSLNSIKQIIYGASPMPKEILQKGLRLWGPIFIQYYGQTEAPLILTLLTKDDHITEDGKPSDRLLSCGKPVETAEVKIIDPEFNTLPAHQIGEIAVKSSQGMIGYYNEPDLTEVTIIDGWIHTRDMGYLDEEGYLYLVDRKSDMIITGGFNVYPKELEDVLYEHPAVAEAAIIGVPDAKWGEAIKAFVVVKDEHHVTEDDIITFCKTKLASYKKPKSVEFIEELPKSAVGKIIRRVLKEPYWEESARKI